MQQNVVMRDIFVIVKQSYTILLKPLNFLFLAGLKPCNNQPVVPYYQGPTVTSWALYLTQTTHLQNNSKKPTLRMITF